MPGGDIRQIPIIFVGTCFVFVRLDICVVEGACMAWRGAHSQHLRAKNRKGPPLLYYALHVVVLYTKHWHLLMV